MSVRLLIAALAVSCIAGSATAQIRVEPLLLTPDMISPFEVGPDHGSECEGIYNNTFGGVGTVTLASVLPLADDLHTTATQDLPLCAFTFGYEKQIAGTFNAVVTFYRSDPADGTFGPVLAGPFYLTGLPGGGAFAVHVEAPSGIVGPDVWMEVTLSTTDAEHILYPTPSVGSSHDRLAVGGTVVNGPFDGEPEGNLYMAVWASRPTPTETATWGKVKAIYR